MGNLDKKYIIRLDTKNTFFNPTLNFSMSDTKTSDFYIRVTDEDKIIKEVDDKLKYAYLEEDCDLGLYIDELKNKNINIEFDFVNEIHKALYFSIFEIEHTSYSNVNFILFYLGNAK